MTDILGFGVSSTSFLNESSKPLVEESWIDGYMKRYLKNNSKYQDNFDDVHRLVILGSSRFFGITNRQGLEQIDVDIGEILLLYPEDRLVVYAEEVEIAPVGASGVEWYRISRPFEVVQVWKCRWEMECKTRKILVEVWKQVEQLYWSIRTQGEYINKGEIPPDCESEESVSVLREFTSNIFI